MKLSYRWLNDFLDLSQYKIADIADILTMKTCEVESIEEYLPHLANITVAKVEELSKHPDADKLKVCQVNTGSETIQIVTGATNVAANGVYPLAAIGVTLPNGMTMKKAQLRGLDSLGMLCSDTELGLEEYIFPEDFSSDEHGLLVLPASYKVGSTLQQSLDCADFILDIDNKSITHRPDLWSHYGFARELSALLGLKLKENPLENEFKQSSSVDKSCKSFAIDIKDKSAINYCGALMNRVEVKPSSLAIQNRLLATGMRPINNVVDISNYVMLEIGQPNHAFDRETLGSKINIAYADKGEKFTTLDAKIHEITTDIVTISDDNHTVALAGVMGGENSEVSNKTTTILLESAAFHRADIRRAVSSLGIRTEASQRFEKGQDPLNSQPAIHRFATLLSEGCPNLEMGTINMVETEKVHCCEITTSIEYIISRLGEIDLTADKIKEILTSLGMSVEIKEDNIKVKVPSYRSYFDITLPEDLVEEIGRVIGYREIASVPLKMAVEVPQKQNEIRMIEHQLRGLLANRYQFNEIYNYSFHSEQDIQLDMRLAKKAIRLQNPIHQDLPFMRISALPGMLAAIAKYHKSFTELRYFEIERLFIPDKELPKEKLFLSAALTNADDDEKNLESIVSMASDLLKNLNLPLHLQSFTSAENENIVFHPGRSGVIKHKQSKLNLIEWGQVHPKITDELSLPKIFYFEAFLENLQQIDKDISYYTPVSKYPASDFEFTVVTNAKRPFAELLPVIGKVEKPGNDESYLTSIEHLGTYQGEQIEPGQKAVSIRVVWRNSARTLESSEIKSLQEALLDRLARNKYILR